MMNAKQTTSIKRLPPRIALSELAQEPDPYPTYARLRQAAPICRAGVNQWLVTGYSDVSALLQDPSLKQFQISGVLRQLPDDSPAAAVRHDPSVQFTERILAGRDGDDHKQLRVHMGRALKRTMLGLDAIIHDELDRILAAARVRRGFDAVADVAFPLPIRVLGELIGIPASSRVEAGRQSLILARVFSPDYAGQQRDEVNQAVTWLRACVSEVIERGTVRTGGSDFVSCFMAEGGAAWPREDVVDNIVFLLFAGFETSLNLLASGFASLLDEPDQQECLRSTPALMPTAIEEFLRFNSPVHITGRLTSQAIEIAGQHVGAGRVVYLCLASANRDPSAFREPDRLDVARQPNRHVAFGAGPHHCLGAVLARREACLVFERCLGELGRLTKSGEVLRTRSATLRSIHQLAVAF
jgi:cytochrome P450